MSTDLGALRARLLLESQQFSQSMQQAQSELNMISNSAQQVNQSLQETQEQIEQTGSSTEGLNQNLEETQEQLNSTGFSAQQLGEDFDRIQTASMALGAAVVAAIGASVKTAADFEAQMSRVKAISGATDAEFKALQKSALELGAKTSKSASEVAVAFEDMAAMGFNATQIIEAMPGVIAAAEASGSDLALTSGIVASALNAFQMEAKEATRVADILAMTANVSAAGIEDMGYALKYVGPVANSLGISLEEVSAAIGIMTDNGLDGSQAGTSLRAALLALNNPAKAQEKIMKELGFSMKDSNGEAKSLSKIFGDLIKATEKMTEAEKVATVAKLVGTEASSGMIAVMAGGVGKLDDFTKSLKNSAGASKEAADVMMNNLKGAAEEFTGALETVGIELGNEFLPLLTDVVKKGAEVVSSVDEMDLAAMKSGLTFAGTAAAIGLTITTIGKLGLAIKGLMISMGPAGWLITGVSVLGGLIASMNVGMSETNEIDLEAIRIKKELSETLNKNISEYELLQMRNQLSNNEMARFLDISSEISKTANAEIIERLREEQTLLQEKSGLTNEELQRLVELNAAIIETVPEATVTITEQGNALLNNTDAAKSFNKELAESLRQQIELEMQAASETYRDALKEEERILAKINKLNEKKEEHVARVKELQAKVNQEQEKYNEMVAVPGQYQDKQISDQAMILTMAKQDLEIAKEEVAELAKDVQKRQESLAVARDTIRAQEELLEQLIEIEVKEAGLNYKKGEGLSIVEEEILKLKEKKLALELNTDETLKNTQEYKDSVKEIENQIVELEGVRSKIINIIEEAAILNTELGKAISKSVTVKYQHVGATAPHNKGNTPIPAYHTGGITGRNPINQIPKLHTGGMASKFLEMPMHNEIDVRLLRDEMVLTEAQQANLLRLIDAGFTENRTSEREYTSPAVQSITYITVEGNIDKDLYDEIMSKQYNDTAHRMIVSGVKSP